MRAGRWGGVPSLCSLPLLVPGCIICALYWWIESISETAKLEKRQSTSGADKSWIYFLILGSGICLTSSQNKHPLRILHVKLSQIESTWAWWWHKKECNEVCCLGLVRETFPEDKIDKLYLETHGLCFVFLLLQDREESGRGSVTPKVVHSQEQALLKLPNMCISHLTIT